MTQDIKEFKQELNILFDQLTEYYHLSDDRKFELVEKERELFGDLKVLIPHKVRLSSRGQFIEVIDLTKELSVDIDSIERRLISAIKRLSFYDYLYSYAEENDYEITLDSRDVSLFIEDRMEIAVQFISKDNYSVRGKYILSSNARFVRYKIDSLLNFELCDSLPSNASIKSAIVTNEIGAQGFKELEHAIKETKRHLDYASERFLKMELVEKKGKRQ